MRILIVDDNLDAAESLQDLVEGEGRTVTLASGGMEALRKYSEQRIDLVFMDLKTPGVNGYDSTRLIFDLDSKARIVIFIGNTFHEEIAPVMCLNILELVRKPYDPAAIRNLVATQQLSGTP